MKLLLALLLAFSAHGATDCELFKGRACVYVPEGAGTSLHLYIRGHHNGRRDFSPAERTKVADETLKAKRYGLMSSAERLKSVVVATGSSAVSFTEKDVEDLENKYQLHFMDIILSAHSGGYFGLDITLRELAPRMGMIKQILMLDNFYSTKDDVLIGVLKSYHEAGVPCRGFMTDHNQERVKKFYQFCEVEGPKGFDHDTSVGPFLERFL